MESDARPHLHPTVEEHPQRTLKGSTRRGGGTWGVGSEGTQEGNASRRRPRSMSHSKGKSSKIKTEICTAAVKKSLALCPRQCLRRGEDASHMHRAEA